MRRDSIANTLVVALCLCVVCSVVVSTAAVVLKPRQEQNRLRDRKRNILAAAGLYDPQVPLETLFERIQTRIVDLRTGQFVDPDEVDPETYDQRTAVRDTMMTEEIPGRVEEFGFARRERYSFVYLVEEEGQLDQIILPVYGKGLWSTLYAFLALDSDLVTIRGITFYEHAETPGLGGEVDNPRWQARWEGKEVFDEAGNVAIRVIRGEAEPDHPHQIDGLAGATITSRGVSGMVRFWLGAHGFGPFLDNLAPQRRLPSSAVQTATFRPGNEYISSDWRK
jgi:Na+-transporting NADH:ubiquinone oxidoreductase subunit C